jgi:dienelactone hydrolase
MACLALFHSVYGLRPAVRVAADRFRALGHEVTTPDLYGAPPADTLAAGFALADRVGWPAMLDRARHALRGLAPGTVLAGLSMGTGIVHDLLPERPATAGVLLLSGVGGDFPHVPGGLRAQLHVADPDEEYAPETAVDRFVARMTAAQANFEVYRARHELRGLPRCTGIRASAICGRTAGRPASTGRRPTAPGIGVPSSSVSRRSVSSASRSGRSSPTSSKVGVRLQLRDLDQQAVRTAHLQLRAEVGMAGRLGAAQPPAQLVQRCVCAEVELHRALAASGVRRLGDQRDLRGPDLHEDPVAVAAAVDDLAAQMLVEGDGRGHVADVHQRPELEVHTGFNE